MRLSISRTLDAALPKLSTLYGLCRALLVASSPARDLLICAKHLFRAASRVGSAMGLYLWFGRCVLPGRKLVSAIIHLINSPRISTELNIEVSSSHLRTDLKTYCMIRDDLPPHWLNNHW